MKDIKLSKPAKYLVSLLFLTELASIPYVAILVVDYLRVSPNTSALASLRHTRIPASFAILVVIVCIMDCLLVNKDSTNL
ncbi:hypothetical protein AALB53_22620 [Lachnospiraceae bacterium 47-T17]